MKDVKSFFDMIAKIQKKLNLMDDNGVKLSFREDGYTTIHSQIDKKNPYTWDCIRSFDTVAEFFDWLNR